MQTLGIIPARSGSKGLPGKNIVNLGGKPLIAWTIESALNSSVIDRLVVSTDDGDIANIARKYGAEIPFMRPAALAQDDSPSAAVIAHAMKELGYAGAVVLLQPTSPLRSPADIAACVDLHRQTRKTVVSITETKIHPSWLFGLDAGNKLVVSAPVASQRQNDTRRYVPNGAVYVFASDTGLSFDDAIGYVMPPDRSIDIDTPYDLHLAAMEIEHRKRLAAKS